MNNPWKKKVILAWKGWGYSLFIAVLIATSFKSAIADWNIVPTGSMKPTIVEGDRIFVNKLAYDLKIPYTTRHLLEWNHPGRGDVVVFYSPMDNRRLVKRVVGLPGDRIAMRNNVLSVNGKAIGYDPVEPLKDGEEQEANWMTENLAGKKHPVMLSPRGSSPRSSFGPLAVPEGHYFMLGDNRDNSADSRYFGFVERGRIVGRATFIVASLDQDRHYAPRWERFFTRLP